MSIRVGKAAQAASFEQAAKRSIHDTQLRHNLKKATQTIRGKRAAAVAEMPDWEALRDAGEAIKRHTMRHLDRYLDDFEKQFTAAGGQVHWAGDADEACEIIRGIVKKHGSTEVIKVKTMTSNEIELNADLEAHGISPCETDLAELIIQLGGDEPSHIVVPAIHKNRTQIQQIFRNKMPLKEMGMENLGPTAAELAEASRRYLRKKFLHVKVAVSGANFAVAETGSLVIVESEGNGRMCVTLPEVLISVVGIEKIIPRFQDLEVFLQLLPRSATGERMNPYTSIWTGVHEGDGPREMHVVLLDNGRTRVLADEAGRDTLHCIRCAACLNACPVYEHAGGQAYGSVYSGPIGAILTPQLQAMEHSQSLPYASSLCGACYEVCPVKINIPEILIYLRSKAVEQTGAFDTERLAMRAMARVFSSEFLLRQAYNLARLGSGPFVKNGVIAGMPGLMAGWSSVRDMMPIPKQSFREWWAERERAK